MKIKKLWPNDGSKRAGQPYGPTYEVIKILDHTSIDGPCEKNVVYLLSDGTYEFKWNVIEIDESDLNPEFTKYFESGEQVEVEWKEGWGMMMGNTGCKTGGNKTRFYVGKSTGWKPIYLMLLKKNSSGGCAISKNEEGIKSIKGTGKFRG